MSSLAQDLAAVLQRLAPPGYAWPKGDRTTARGVLEGLVATPAEFERRVDQLLVELDPRSAAELLPDFERLLGLPSDCTAGELQTLSERRAAVVQKIVAIRGSTPA